MKIELLILISGNETFCCSKKSFLEFLRVDSLLTVTNTTISYKNRQAGKEDLLARITVETNKVKASDERYFRVVLECDRLDLIDDFFDLAEKVKSITKRISPGATIVNTLWDGIGSYYAEMSYPIINEVENLMRQFIAQFMLITVGMNWSKNVVHPELLKKIEQFEDGDPFVSDLHKLDFIHLSQVLFEKKRDISLEELDRILSATKFESEDKERILRYIPRSNWDKYFSTIIEEKDRSFEELWSRLYKLRNKVAHNRSVTKKEYEAVRGLASKAKGIIQQASLKLGEINIGEEDREAIIYSYSSESLAARSYKSEKALAEYYMRLGYVPNSKPVWSQGSAFDLVVSKPGETIAVEITSLPLNATLIIMRSTVDKVFQRWCATKESHGFLRVHIIFVVLGVDIAVSGTAAIKLKSRVGQIRSSIVGEVDIIVGTLAEDESFVSFDF